MSAKEDHGSNSTLIGPYAGADMTYGSNNVLIGINTGRDITNESNVVIIGDNITSLDKSQENVLFIGDKVAIGEYLFGVKINLKEAIEKCMEKYAKREDISVSGHFGYSGDDKGGY